MERGELDRELAEEIRARVLGDGFMKIVQTVRRNGKTFRISMRPVEIGGERRFQAEMVDDGQTRAFLQQARQRGVNNRRHISRS